MGAMENVGLVTFTEHYAFRLVMVVVIDGDDGRDDGHTGRVVVWSWSWWSW